MIRRDTLAGELPSITGLTTTDPPLTSCTRSQNKLTTGSKVGVKNEFNPPTFEISLFLHNFIQNLLSAPQSNNILLLFFLSKTIADPENVIIVHCNSGKGRTGTAICAILLFLGFFNNVDDCLLFYGYQRFTCGKGVS